MGVNWSGQGNPSPNLSGWQLVVIMLLVAAVVIAGGMLESMPGG